MDNSPPSRSATASAPAPRTASASAKDSGLRNLPLHDVNQYQIWLYTILLAGDLLTWTATLGLTAHWTAEPKRICLRLLHVAARIIRTGRRTVLKLPAHWPSAPELAAAHSQSRAPSPPG